MADRSGVELCLIRHGETEWSRSGQHTSYTDLDLTPVGERQARAVGALLETSSFDLILVSPRRRARRTAELAGLGPAETDDDLGEWDYGALEGLTTAQIQDRLPGWTIWDGPWPDCETAFDVETRVDRFIARVRALPDGSRVAAVAHGHIIRVLTARWLGFPVAFGRHLGISTATLSRLGWEHGVPAIKCWNVPASGS